MADKPSKSDLEAVFHRLRAIPANKVCFDCNAKNPTWSSVTYGVFICIDCSAVHRNLGVHLTFVRSTQLDTNWTWVQLRSMQLGGNANASQFFNQHNCVTTDAPKKYNSRAAQLYRDKLNQLAVQSLNTNPGKLHVQTEPIEEKHAEKEVDFFTEHENFPTTQEIPVEHVNTKLSQLHVDNSDSGAQPSVDFTLNPETVEERKPIIGARKIQPKKSGLGAKKGGLGATRVKTNFADLEKEAAAVEEFRTKAAEESAKAAALSAEQQVEREAAVRLAYKDLSIQQQENEKQMKKTDPKKAEQVERLGMGFNSRSGISHSAISDMQCIEQENVQTSSSSLSSLGKLRSGNDTDGFFDDYSFSSSFNMNRNLSGGGYGANKAIELCLAENNGSTSSSAASRDRDRDRDISSSWANESPVESKPKPRSDKTIKPVSNSDDLAQKKFGSAKAISSDQFFDNHSSDYETQTALNRFQGSSSISSAELFGNGQERTNNGGQHFHPPDLEEVRESVRQGVHKVAGKLSSLANGVMSSIQDRYGY